MDKAQMAGKSKTRIIQFKNYIFVDGKKDSPYPLHCSQPEIAFAKITIVRKL